MPIYISYNISRAKRPRVDMGQGLIIIRYGMKIVIS